MVIMMLKEEGKLNYDDLVEKYLPGLPYKNITIRHLLTHTSGRPDFYFLKPLIINRLSGFFCFRRIHRIIPRFSYLPMQN